MEYKGIPGNQEHSKPVQNLGKMKTVAPVYQTMLLYTRILALGFNKGTNYKMKCKEVKDEGFT